MQIGAPLPRGRLDCPCQRHRDCSVCTEPRSRARSLRRPPRQDPSDCREAMKVTLNWLKQYVDFNWSPEELAERLTMLGVEVEGIHKVAGEFDGIVVAQVLTRDKHPNAD